VKFRCIMELPVTGKLSIWFLRLITNGINQLFKQFGFKFFQRNYAERGAALARLIIYNNKAMLGKKLF